MLILSVCKAILFIKKNNIKTIIGFGSYVQVPFVFAALILKKNVILHEGNSVMGKANRVFWKYIKIRTSAFNLKEYSNTIHVGMPVREKIISLYRSKYKTVTKKGIITLLVLGGSQGSKLLSYKLCQVIVKLPLDIRKRINIFHQVRHEDLMLVKKAYKKSKIKAHVLSFFQDIEKSIKKASLVISRAGASTIYENAIAGTPAIYFPLSNSIGNHQYKNALFFKNRGAAWVFDENDIDKGRFLQSLKEIIINQDLLKKTSINKKKIAKPHAAEKIKELKLGLENADI